MPLDKTIKVNGKDVPINRQQMARGFKLRLTASSEMANKLIDRRQNEDFANITGLTKSPGIFNLVPVATDFARSYGKDDPEKYVNPQLAQLNQVALQAPQLIPAMMAAAQQAMTMAKQIQEGGQTKAVAGMMGAGPPGNGGSPPGEGVSPQPPTGEQTGAKFAPQPRDVISAVGV